jgi:hypothetical protein
VKIGPNLNFKFLDDQNQFRPVNRSILPVYRYEIDKSVQIQNFEKSLKNSGKILQKTRENSKRSSEDFFFSNLHHLVG